jgi:hypothetical protein
MRDVFVRIDVGSNVKVAVLDHSGDLLATAMPGPTDPSSSNPHPAARRLRSPPEPPVYVFAARAYVDGRIRTAHAGSEIAIVQRTRALEGSVTRPKAAEITEVIHGR